MNLITPLQLSSTRKNDNSISLTAASVRWPGLVETSGSMKCMCGAAAPTKLKHLPKKTQARYKSLITKPSVTFCSTLPHERRRLVPERHHACCGNLSPICRRRSPRRLQFTTPDRALKDVKSKGYRRTRPMDAFASASVYPRRIMACLVETSRGVLEPTHYGGTAKKSDTRRGRGFDDMQKGCAMKSHVFRV